ncbi:diguanylate cyclase domain-containing protein [Magnetospirillum gryphiswaldense]|uniref:PAS:GGDEF n=1 Tax=Magnetospirillum gryphiswaldense TaxID=55518 RepID=A4TY04_9PROT|nr:diguanylate cyclase [Magnetospirillum gryphiswaldense]AVM76112.1 putative diguanylate cyclase YegE [Magnetospirillum gryphiswaldense MSR-1]AVM80015.1 putative diguanylate cyclase YegE [Magnetospirillum gryphiswaldense]CAM75511.1 PAS:GGDEF [Magnetospirillum gryphiswaldense MSR-1]
MFERVSIRLRLYSLALTMLALAGVIGVGGLNALHDRLLIERQNQSRMLVQGALGYMDRLDGMVRAGALTQGEAMDRAINAVAAMSARQGDYLWINDLQPRVIWHPMGSWMGRDVSDFTDSDGRYLFREFVDRTNGTGGTFVHYSWPDPKTGQIGAKISYVERFAPWGWVVGSGLYLDDLHQAWRQGAVGWGLTAGLALLVCMALAWVLGQSITRPLGKITRSMRLLAQGHDVEVPETNRGDEIGDLTRAMAVFRQYLIQREEARLAHDRVLAQAKTVFDHISEAVMLTDETNRIIMVNPSFARITGYSLDEVVGKTPDILSSGRHDNNFYQALWRELRESGEWHGEIWNRTKSGAIYPESLSITQLRQPDGRMDGYVATFMDITDRKRREARVRWRAEHDSLTGLCNRAQFEARLADAVRIAADSSSLAAVMYLDLDGFKPVNDSLGHAAGDQVLKRVAKRIEAAVRGDDVVARLGGDEFVVLVEGLAAADDVARIAAKLVDSLAQPFNIDHQSVTIGVSIGIALFPRDGTNPATLLVAADTAMYQAKHQGRGGFAFAQPGQVLVSVEG